MKNLYIMGLAGSGKTAIALGFAQKLQREGKKVAYFKPVGNPPRGARQVDGDAVLMKEVLQMDNPLNDIMPHVSGTSYLSSNKNKEAMQNILGAYERVSKDADITLIDGSIFPYLLSSQGMDDMSLVAKFNAKVLPVLKATNDFNVDLALVFNDHLKLRGIPAVGNIFNNVQRPLQAKVEGVFKPILEERGYNVLGIIPRRPEIASPTVQEFYDVLGGELLAGHNRLHLLVEDVLIGAMTLDSALRYFRRAADRAVIIGGDRADLALAALETGTTALILTGGLYPDVKVIARAQEKGIPVILVHYDTYTTVERLSEVSRYINPTDRTAIRITLDNIDQFCDFDAIVAALED